MMMMVSMALMDELIVAALDASVASARGRGAFGAIDAAEEVREGAREHLAHGAGHFDQERGR